jgi:hypothetical protein
MALPRDSWKTQIASPPAQEPAPRFDIGGQNGGVINNVGGDQNVFLPGKAIVVGGSSAGLTPAERAAAVAGLLLFWSGVVLLAVMVYRGAHTLVHDLQSSSAAGSDWTKYAPHHWGLALTLILLGIVLPRLALRLFGRSAGPG